MSGRSSHHGALEGKDAPVRGTPPAQAWFVVCVRGIGVWAAHGGLQ